MLLPVVLAFLLAMLAVVGEAFPQGNAPHGRRAPRAEGKEDTYAQRPSGGSFEERRAAYLALSASDSGRGPFSQAARIAAGQAPNVGEIDSALDAMDRREDCSDFRLHGILRLLYQFGGHPLLSEELKGRMRESLLNYKYWPDEPGVDSMCSWSENHHILFAAGGLLAGQLYPEAVFRNSGQTGQEKMAIARERVLRWLDLRYRSGFSEWLSNVYYNEDLPPLLNLVDFCADAEIAQRAAMVVDLILADIALNSFHGVFGSTHGRTYEMEKKYAAEEHVNSVVKLMFGMNQYSAGNMSAVSLALSTRYRMPRVLYEMAADLDRPEMVNRQRMGIRVKDAKQWGLDYRRLEDGMTFFSLEAYTHPKTIDLTLRMFDAYRFWENDFFRPFTEQRTRIEKTRKWHMLPLALWYYRRDLQRNQREEANIYTYRTPNFMLSTAQDYRRGYGGDQQHIWQATLAPDAVCFTTHPVQGSHRTPNYWEGSGSLPRAAQVKNVAIVLYRIWTKRGLYVTHDMLFTHAWLPKDAFDEVIERDGWVFARRENGYLGLWSREPYRWQEKRGRDRQREILADGKENIWICELGRQETDGTFEAFIERLATARIRTDGLRVRYDSPSQGRLEFGWNVPLKQNGARVQLDDYPRYENPYGQAPFPGGVISFNLNGEWLKLDWKEQERNASGYCGGE